MTNRLDSKDIPGFVTSNPVAVLCIGRSFSHTVAERMKPFEAGLAVLDAARIEMSDRAFASWVHAQQRRMGWPECEIVPGGYYLFIAGEIQGYHAGLIDVESDDASLAMGLAGLVAGLALGSTNAVGTALALAEIEAGRRVASFLEECIHNWLKARWIAKEAERQRLWEEYQRDNAARQATAAEADLLRAFKILGRPPDTSHQELKSAHRRLAIEWHPDKADDNEDLIRIANERMAEINAAFDLICANRGWAK